MPVSILSYQVPQSKEASSRQNARWREKRRWSHLWSRWQSEKQIVCHFSSVQKQQKLFPPQSSIFYLIAISFPHLHVIAASVLFFFPAGIYQPLQLRAVCQVSSDNVMVNNDFQMQPRIDSLRSVQNRRCKTLFAEKEFLSSVSNGWICFFLNDPQFTCSRVFLSPPILEWDQLLSFSTRVTWSRLLKIIPKTPFELLTSCWIYCLIMSINKVLLFSIFENIGW